MSIGTEVVIIKHPWMMVIFEGGFVPVEQMKPTIGMLAQVWKFSWSV